MLLTLSSNLTIERSGEGVPTTGELLFKKSKFALFMDVANVDTLKKRIVIQFQVVRKNDNEVVETIKGDVPIQEFGRWTGAYSNQNEIDSNKEAVVEKRKEIDIKKEQLNTKNVAVFEAKTNFQLANTLFNDLKKEKSILEEKSKPSQADMDRLAELETEIPAAKIDRDQKKGIRDQEVDAKNEIQIELQNLRDELQELLESKPKPVQELVDLYDEVIGTHIINNELTTSGLVWVKTLPLLGKTVGDYIV